MASVLAGGKTFIQELNIGGILAPIPEMIVADDRGPTFGFGTIKVLGLVIAQDTEPVTFGIANGDGVDAAEIALALGRLSLYVELMAKTVNMAVGVLQGATGSGIGAVPQANTVLVGEIGGEDDGDRHLVGAW